VPAIGSPEPAGAEEDLSQQRLPDDHRIARTVNRGEEKAGSEAEVIDKKPNSAWLPAQCETPWKANARNTT
jgi:hypothetical protein